MGRADQQRNGENVRLREFAASLRPAFEAAGLSFGRRLLLAAVSLAVAAAFWLPALYFFFRPRVTDYRTSGSISPKARALAASQMHLWTDRAQRDQEILKMRASNAEWDFMGRTYLVLALANMALREPAEQATYLDVMDRIIADTTRLEKEHGFTFFLMDYGRARPFVEKPPRSLFTDGEITMMMAVRCLVREKPEYKPLMQERVEVMEKYMRRGDVLCAESYPDECWMFCNTVALATMRMADALDGSDHRAFCKEWVASAKRRLVEKKTGLLVSSFSLSGEVFDGPEGSSIWMAAHCLQLVDEEFARDQYVRGKKELSRRLLGFGYAREWPVSYVGPHDIDSGPVVPGLGASPSSSGLAVMAAAAFGDTDYFASLCSSLNLGAFPVERNGTLKFCASNQVGEAVLLYAMVLGPAWEKVKRMNSQ